MKTTVKRLGLLSAMAGLIFGSQAAFAHVNTHGVAFHNYNAGEGDGIDYLATGVRNVSGVARSVIASIGFVRAAGPNVNVKFTIDGKNAANLSTSFTLFAQGAVGFARHSVNFVTGPGPAPYSTDQTLNNLDHFCRISLYAALPASTGAVIYGITQQQ